MKPTDSPVRSVFDCNVFLQAMANPSGPAGACIRAVRTGQISLFVSPSIVAIATGAHVITSRDRHLLSLRDPTDPVGIEFMAQFPSIEVLSPVQLLERIRSG
jgi:predicted nucleic acid-binding protein